MIDNFGRVLENVLIKDYTTYKLSGKLSKVVYPKSVIDLQQLLKYLNDANIKYKVIGNGSNLIFVNDYDGVIIKLDELNNLEIHDEYVSVGAGYNLMKLSMKCASLGLSGLEFASGIPGTIGGAIYMNAGAYGSSMDCVVCEVIIIDDNYEVKKLKLDDLHFGYRDSIFKYKDYICIGAVLKLSFADKEKIFNLMNLRKQKRLISQPLEYPSAGSVFRNPEGEFAGALIESLGFKGTKIGDAMVSDKHANFIVNVGGASGKEVISLINNIKDEVLEKYNIELLVEQEIIE